MTDGPQAIAIGPDQEPPRTLQALGGVVGLVERVLGRFSRFGDTPFPDPAAFPWTARIEARWPEIRRELDALLGSDTPIPGFEEFSEDQRFLTDDKRWKTFFFLGYGVKFDANIATCPQTWSALRSIPGLTTAFFSILEPNKQLAPHRGPYKGVLRYHLGVLIPSPAELCSITVAGETRHWAEGKSLIFDDAYLHSAENNSDGVRVVLFVDFARPLLFPINIVNALVLWVLSRSGYVQDAKRNYAAWEKKQRK